MTADCFPGITLCYDAWWEGAGTGAVGARGKSPYFALFTEMERSGVDLGIRFLSSLFQDGRRDAIGNIEIKFDPIQP